MTGVYKIIKIKMNGVVAFFACMLKFCLYNLRVKEIIFIQVSHPLSY